MVFQLFASIDKLISEIALYVTIIWEYVHVCNSRILNANV